MAETNIEENLQDDEALKRVIKKGVVGICDKGGHLYPNICAYGSRSPLDQEQIVEKVFTLMTSETLPMDIESALTLVDNELAGGFGD